MQNDDQHFWANTENYSDVGIHNRLEATVYDDLTVTWQLSLLPLPGVVGGEETPVVGASGTCVYVGSETADGITRYIYRATWESELLTGRQYALDFRCDSINFGKRLKKTAAMY